MKDVFGLDLIKNIEFYLINDKCAIVHNYGYIGYYDFKDFIYNNTVSRRRFKNNDVIILISKKNEIILSHQME